MGREKERERREKMKLKPSQLSGLTKGVKSAPGQSWPLREVFERDTTSPASLWWKQGAHIENCTFSLNNPEEDAN